MKKLLLLLVMMLSVAISTFAAEEVEINGLWYEVVLETKEAKVIQYKNDIKYSGDIVIPETVEYDGANYSVTSIKREAFAFCSSLSSLDIPESVTSIGSAALLACTGLTRLTIPFVGMDCSQEKASLATLFGYIFSETNTTYTDGRRIGQYYGSMSSNYVYYCIPTSLKEVKVLGGKLFFGAFYGCCDIETIILGNNVTLIDWKAFYNCKSMTKITIGNGVETIDGQVFASCPKLTDVYCYAENVPSTDNSAFSDSNIENATLHVPAASVDVYKATTPWSGFKSIVALTTSDPGSEDVPLTGDGTLENPYTASDAISVGSKLAVGEKTAEGYYIKGKVSTIKYQFDDKQEVGSFYISDDGTTTHEFLVYRVYYLENKPWVFDNPKIAVGDEVIIFGKIMNYNGTPETVSREAYIYSLNGEAKNVLDPKANEITVGKALEIIISLDDGAIADEKYKVRGFIVGSPEFKRRDNGTLYGYVIFTMADTKGGLPLLTAYRAMSYKNTAFTEETTSLLTENDEVVLLGKLQKFVKEDVVTPELINGYLLSITHEGYDVKQCAKPTILFDDGKLKFRCETEEVEFRYNITNIEAAAGIGSEVEMPDNTEYLIKVYAKKDGYMNSEEASMSLVRSVGLKGDANSDGEVDIADAVHIVNYVVGKIEQLAPQKDMDQTDPE